MLNINMENFQRNMKLETLFYHTVARVVSIIHLMKFRMGTTSKCLAATTS